VRFRDHVEAVALSRGEAVERTGALGRFRNVVGNWWQLITAQRNLSLLTTGIGQANGVVPLLVAAPAFFAGRMTLGSLTETGVAYGQVSGALAWFVDAYQEIAAWRASVERLASFSDMLGAARTALTQTRGIQIAAGATPALRLIDLTLSDPEGPVLAEHLDATVPGGARVALLGPPGQLKTTLFRAIAGIWPFGSGRIELPAGAQPIFVPHQPYLPIGTLRDAVSYPAAAGTFPDVQIAAALRLVELEPLAGRLDESEPWEQELSVDEQLRLTFARALLQRPDWIVMDDATAGLDEKMERRVFDLLAKELPGASLLSITNRPAVASYLPRRLALEVGDGKATIHPVQAA
jgi:putative ATP-binding cassette transporter